MRLSTPKTRLSRSLRELSEVAVRLQAQIDNAQGACTRSPVDPLAQDLDQLSAGLEELVSDIVLRLRRVTTVLQHSAATRKQKTA